MAATKREPVRLSVYVGLLVAAVSAGLNVYVASHDVLQAVNAALLIVAPVVGGVEVAARKPKDPYDGADLADIVDDPAAAPEPRA